MCLFKKNKLQNMEEEFLAKFIGQQDDFDDDTWNDAEEEELEEEEETDSDDSDDSDDDNEEIETDV